MYRPEDDLSSHLFHSFMTRIFFVLSRAAKADANLEDNDVFKWNRKRINEKNFANEEPTLHVISTGDKFWWNGNLSNQKSVVMFSNKNFKKLAEGNNLSEFTKMEQMVAARLIEIEKDVDTIEVVVPQVMRTNEKPSHV